jgi:hypothetical protein
MLEFYDFVTYSFFAIQIGRTFFPSQSQFASLMLSLATYPKKVSCPSVYPSSAGLLLRSCAAWQDGAA